MEYRIKEHERNKCEDVAHCYCEKCNTKSEERIV